MSVENAQRLGSVLTFRNVSYTVSVREKGCSPREKKIIKNISGIMRPGMNAIMGPTGSGKTTLMDILAKRADVGQLSGEVEIDGRHPPRNFKCMSGYVVQDDIVMGTLTVKENLSFSAALRLPSSMSKTEKEERVNMVLADLGLTGIANSKIGNQFIRGVSGGERKRTNIGMELVIQPNILFLDEPTTGLDAHTAVSVMKLLRDLAAQGRTIIFAIHQPRYSIFKLFDSLTLLANGQTVYHGDATKALKYFEENGLHCEEHDNPADFFLDIIQSFEDNQKAPSGLLCEVHENFTDSDLDTTLSVENDGKGSSGLSLVDAYKSSDLHNQTNANLEAMIHQQQLDDDRKADEHKQSVTYATNFLFQTWICMKRAATNVARDPQLSIFRIVMMVVFGLIVGLIYLRLSDDSKGIQNRVGGFFFIIINLVFGNMGTIELFMAERTLYRHEASSGYYHIWAYFLARVIIDLTLVNMLPYMLFSAIVYWMIGFVSNAGKFFYFMVMVVLTALAGNGISYTVGAGVTVYATGSLFVALIYTFMMVFGGLLLNLTSIPIWLRWLQWLSVFRYALEGMSVNELKGALFCDDKNNGTCAITASATGHSEMCQPLITNGTAYLIEQDFDIDNALWYDPLALVLFFIGFLLIAMLELKYCRKNR